MTSILARPGIDAWDLKPNYEPGKKLFYNVSGVASADGHEVDVKFGHRIVRAAAEASGDRKIKVAWTEIEVNSQPQDTPGEFEVLVAPDGTIKESLAPKDDVYRRFLSVFTFAYPAKPVQVGDKWTVEQQPTASGAKKMTFSLEAKEAVKLNEREVLRITSTQTEDGPDALKNDSTWWVARDGTIVKFALDIKRWVVPFAGDQAMDVTLKGEIRPN